MFGGAIRMILLFEIGDIITYSVSVWHIIHIYTNYTYHTYHITSRHHIISNFGTCGEMLNDPIKFHGFIIT